MHEDYDNKLRKLLQLKRLEIPSEAMWEEFDRSFENARLAAMKGSFWTEFLGKVRGAVVYVFEPKHVALCTVAVFTLAVFLLTGLSVRHGAAESRVARSASHEYIRFVKDSIMSGSGGVNGSRFDINDIEYNGEGMNYVYDMIKLSRVDLNSGRSLALMR